MKNVQLRYPPEIYGRMGKEMYDRVVKPQLLESDRGKICAIDIETGDFELADDELTAVENLQRRRSDAQPWLVCAGYDHLHRIGGASVDPTSYLPRLRKS